MEISYGGIPGRPIGDGMDGHSLVAAVREHPHRVPRVLLPDPRRRLHHGARTPAAPDFHRGGNGIEKRYIYLEPGEVSIHDDRWLTYPWGILGGTPGQSARRRSS